MRRRTGYTLLEASAAIAVLAIAGAIFAQLLHAVALEQRRAGERVVATTEAANLLERLLASHWDEVTPKHAEDLPLSTEARDLLPGLRAEVSIAETAGEDNAPPGKQLTVTLHWESDLERGPQSVRLVGWKFTAEQEQP